MSKSIDDLMQKVYPGNTMGWTGISPEARRDILMLALLAELNVNLHSIAENLKAYAHEHG